MKFMLDTNICIYIIKKHPPEVLTKFLGLTPRDVCLSAVTLAELKYGVQKSQHKEKNYAMLDQFLIPLEILPFDIEAANHYGILRETLQKTGMQIGSLDLMIAAHARSIYATLVTNNQKEFNRVPLLKVQNWVKMR